MIFGIRFLIFRLTIFTIAAIAQGYLFVQIRRAIRSSRGSDRFKSRAIRLVGAVIIALFCLNAYIMLPRMAWIDPPALAPN